MTAVATSSRDRRHSAILLGAGAIGAILVMAGCLALYGTGKEGWQLAARYTARHSVCWFLGVFTASALTGLLPGAVTRVMRRERRGLGLGFFAAHTVHLAAILGFMARGGSVPGQTLAGGGLGYAFLFAMAATSSDRAVHALGARRWRLLHLAGSHYLWFIFALTYFGRLSAAGPVSPVHCLLFVVVVLALPLRLLATRVARKRTGR